VRFLVPFGRGSLAITGVGKCVLEGRDGYNRGRNELVWCREFALERASGYNRDGEILFWKGRNRLLGTGYKRCEEALVLCVKRAFWR